MTDYRGMTNAQLVDVHNQLAFQLGANDIKAWKKAKDLLIDRIGMLQAEVQARETIQRLDAEADVSPEDPTDSVADKVLKSAVEDGIVTQAQVDKAAETNKKAKPSRDVRAAGTQLDTVLEEIDVTVVPKEKKPRSRKPKGEKSTRAKKGAAPGEDTIRKLSLDLLCRVAFWEDKSKASGPENRLDDERKGTRSVGLSYDEIIAEVRKAFVGAKTSRACLRWYAVKVRTGEPGYEGFKLAQRRPRSLERKAH